MSTDPIANELHNLIGNHVRIRVGESAYVGELVAAGDNVTTIVSGAEPVRVTVRTEAIDAFMPFKPTRDNA